MENFLVVFCEGQPTVWCKPMSSILLWCHQRQSYQLSCRLKCWHSYHNILLVCYSPEQDGGCITEYLHGKYYGFMIVKVKFIQ